MLTSDPNLLFGVLALQSELVNADQFAEACRLWSMNKGEPLADVLIRKGWISSADRGHLEYLVDRKVEKNRSDAGSSAISAPPDIRRSAAGIADADIHRACGEADVRRSWTDATITNRPPLAGRYQLDRLHAAGGIGEIWLARDTHLNRDVAIKRLHPGKAASEIDRGRFLREAQITGQLDHPGVVPVYELCADDQSNQPYYAMRFLKGRTLADAVKACHEKRRAGEAVSREFLSLLNAFVIVCQTVSFAHSKNIIHRDLKCENVVLGDFGEVVVVDWGLAKVLEPSNVSGKTMVGDPEEMESVHPSATLAGRILGTPAYMAPEQADGRSDLVDCVTDVYGLCAILYEILCGRAPFLGENTIDVLHRVCHQDPARPSQVSSDVPADLEEICLRGLSKSRAQRQQSAEDVAASVQQWMADVAERTRSQHEREHFFSLSQNLLAVAADDERMKQTSPAWKWILGISAQDLFEKPFTDFLHPDDQPAARAKFQSVASTNEPATFEARCLAADGSWRFFLWSATWIAEDRLVYLVGRDVTELKRSQQTLQGLLESAPDAFVIVDREGRIVLVNSQTERVFGYSRQELEGQFVEMLVPDAVRARHPALRKNYCQAPTTRPMNTTLRLSGRRKDGREIPIDIALSPVETPEGLMVFSAIRDLSNRSPADLQGMADRAGAS